MLTLRNTWFYSEYGDLSSSLSVEIKQVFDHFSVWLHILEIEILKHLN